MNLGNTPLDIHVDLKYETMLIKSDFNLCIGSQTKSVLVNQFQNAIYV